MARQGGIILLTEFGDLSKLRLVEYFYAPAIYENKSFRHESREGANGIGSGHIR